MTYPLDDPAGLLARWRDAMRAAPEELSSTLALAPRMPGAPPSATVLLCYAAEPGTTASEADARIEPLFELGTSDHGEGSPSAGTPRSWRKPSPRRTSG